jgi:hypothetical protein
LIASANVGIERRVTLPVVPGSVAVIIARDPRNVAALLRRVLPARVDVRSASSKRGRDALIRKLVASSKRPKVLVVAERGDVESTLKTLGVKWSFLSWREGSSQIPIVRQMLALEPTPPPSSFDWSYYDSRAGTGHKIDTHQSILRDLQIGSGRSIGSGHGIDLDRGPRGGGLSSHGVGVPQWGRRLGRGRSAKPGVRVAARPRGGTQQRRRKKGAARRKPPQLGRVLVSTLQPRQVEPAQTFVVEIMLHTAAASPKSMRDRLVTRDRARLRLGREAKIELELTPPPGISVDVPVRRLTWIPPRVSAQFALVARKSLRAGTYPVRVSLSTAGKNGVQLVEFYVEIKVASKAAKSAPVVARVARVPSSYFASYATRNRGEVLRRLATLDALGADVFVDCLDIREGARWEDEISKQVLSREGFLLFWSKAARASKWVAREWRHRLRHRGLGSITPNALEPPQRCPPPKALAKLQFGSRLKAQRRS